MGIARALLASVALLTPAATMAAPETAPAAPPPTEGPTDGPTEALVTAPEDADGIAHGRPTSDGRGVARALLFVPRALATAVLSPPRLAVWAYDRYQLRDRFYRIFFDDTGTAGLYPSRAASGSTAARGSSTATCSGAARS